MLQRLIVPVTALLILAAVAGCGRRDTTPSQPSTEAPPTADVPVMVTPDE